MYLNIYTHACIRVFVVLALRPHSLAHPNVDGEKEFMIQITK